MFLNSDVMNDRLSKMFYIDSMLCHMNNMQQNDVKEVLDRVEWMYFVKFDL